MSFVSFLKRAGQILANVAAVEAIGEPLFKAVMPTSMAAPIDKLDLIFKSVVATEGQFAAAFPTGQTGPQKLLAAAALIGPVLSTVDTIRGKAIANQDAYTAAMQKIAGGVADLMNALQPQANTGTVAAVLTAPAAAVTVATTSAA